MKFNKQNTINEVKMVEYYLLLKQYEKGYRNPDKVVSSFEIGELVLAVVGEDSFIIGRIEQWLFEKQMKLSIICQLGEKYHNSNDDTIVVNNFEIYEILR